MPVFLMRKAFANFSAISKPTPSALDWRSRGGLGPGPALTRIASAAIPTTYSPSTFGGISLAIPTPLLLTG